MRSYYFVWKGYVSQVNAANLIKKSIRNYINRNAIRRTVSEITTTVKLICRIPHELKGKPFIINFYSHPDGTMDIEAYDKNKGRCYTTSTILPEDLSDIPDRLKLKN